MLGSRFQVRDAGMGFIPIILAAATIGAGIYGKKQEEKAAEKQAEAAEKAALAARRQGRTRSTPGTPSWVWIVGGVAALGAGAYFLTRGRR